MRVATIIGILLMATLGLASAVEAAAAVCAREPLVSVAAPGLPTRHNDPDLARYYPERALRAGAQGRAVIECDVLDERLSGCTAVSAAPPDLDFSGAALRIAQGFRARSLVDPAHVVLTFDFALGPTVCAPAAATPEPPPGAPPAPPFPAPPFPARQAALEAIRTRDYRVFAVSGFFSRTVAQIHCPDPAAYARLQARGGVYYSDVVGAPPAWTPQTLRQPQMEDFNRTLAADPGFQQATGCRAPTPCESRYETAGVDIAPVLDPRCLRNSALLVAIAARGSPEDLRRMLRAGADPNGDANHAGEPLRQATYFGRVEQVRLLLDAGAKTTAHNGRSLVTVALQRQRTGAVLPLIDLLLANGAAPTGACNGEDPLTLAALAGDLPIVERLLSAGAAASLACESASPMRAAVSASHDDVVARLIRAGAPVDGAVPAAPTDCTLGLGMAWDAHDGAVGPFCAAVRADLRTGQAHEEPRRTDERLAARKMAMILYRAGAKSVPAGDLAALWRDPDWRMLSIVIAAARQAGREPETIDHLLASAPADVADPVGLRWLQAIRDCPDRIADPQEDHVRLCRTEPPLP